MADEKDPVVSGHYRDLGREEPPPALDEAILAAARRDIARRPRWLYPVAAAAAIGVLAVAVSVHVERERPEEIVAMKETAPVPATKPQEPPPAPEAPRAERRAAPTKPAPVFVPDPRPAAEAAGSGAMADRRDSAGDLAKQSGASGPAAAEQHAPREAERPLAALQLDEAPLPWLQRIAKLREEGKHDEADKALAEFRKRYPDFKIPEDMLGKVVRPQ
jgi:hypothetical protein